LSLFVGDGVFDGVGDVNVQAVAEPQTCGKANVLGACTDRHGVDDLGVAGAAVGRVVQRKRAARGARDEHAVQLAAADFDLRVCVTLFVECHVGSLCEEF